MNLKEKAAALVAQDRFDAFAESNVRGSKTAPAAGKRIDAPMSEGMKLAGYIAVSRQQYQRERSFEESL